MNKKTLYSLVAAVVMLAAAPRALAFEASHYADSSKLAQGTWVKIAVSESGIYQITASDAQRWGFSSLDRLHVFGTGGAPLSETLTEDIADDLPQVPVLRTGNRILFYAQGPLTWQEKNTLHQVQVQHPYSTAGYYFVTDDSRYTDVAMPTAGGTGSGEPITTVTGRVYHEQELTNPGQTGRDLLGEDFSTTRSRTFELNLPGLVAGGQVSVLTRFASKTVNGTSRVSFKQNGTNLPSSGSDVIAAAYSLNHDHYEVAQTVKTFAPGSDQLSYTITYSPSGTVHSARLDYITVNYPRHLALDGSQLCFGLESASTSGIYRVSGGASHVWDVTVPQSPVELASGSSGDALSFTPANGGRRELVAFNADGSFASPTLSERLANQNLHGLPVPDMVIITPTAYRTQAERVAALHEQTDGFRVHVIDEPLIFNEFSSGTPDAMAYRMLCKMFHDRGTDARGHRLGYLLLMGSGIYDNRLISSEAKAASYPRLLTWQSSESKDEDNSYTTDDGFAILSDGAGPHFYGYDLDIAVGRMCVRSVNEARTVVDKLIKYVTKPDYGAWKNNMLNVADDQDNAIHMEQAENDITVCRSFNGNDIIYNRVYLDAFERSSSGGGTSYPDAYNKLYTTAREGVLWWNYTGHASPNDWTAENLLQRVDVQENLYYRHLPVLYAATCEFTRYDGIDRSSGELMFLNSNGGAIAVICPPRLVYIPQNGGLNRSVARYIFERDSNGLQLRLGDILRLGKNNYKGGGDNNARYFLMGDPAMRLAYASHTAVIDAINGHAVGSGDMPVFQARQTVTFTGHIVDEHGQPANGFNGSVVSTLFDCEQSVTTHGWGSEGREFTYDEHSNKLAIRVDTVTAGQFTIHLTIPTEVLGNYDNYRPSLLNLYAYDSADTLEAKGACEDFYIYGYDDSLVADTIGPVISDFGLNGTAFVSGDNVNDSPLVLATLSDESGVNFSTSGIGHTLTLTLDGVTSYNDVSSHYTPAYTETGTLGTISYRLSDLTQGHHTLRLRAWDVYNNVSERTIEFNVVEGLAPDITDLYATPSPASSYTTFYVRHTQPDATVLFDVEVFDLMGRLVWSSNLTGRSDMFSTVPITWDLTDNGGRRVPRGIYIYRATISTDGVKTNSKAKKIAVTAP